MTDKEIMEILVRALEAFDRQLRRVETATRVACGDRRLP